MASKNSAVRSIRLMKPKWEALAAYAEKQGITVNAAMDRAADLLLASGSGGPKPQVDPPKPAKAGKVRAEPEVLTAPANAKMVVVERRAVPLGPQHEPSRISVPFAGDVQRKPYQKGQKR